jgi:hypothetical protein
LYKQDHWVNSLPDIDQQLLATRDVGFCQNLPFFGTLRNDRFVPSLAHRNRPFVAIPPSIFESQEPTVSYSTACEQTRPFALDEADHGHDI